MSADDPREPSRAQSAREVVRGRAQAAGTLVVPPTPETSPDWEEVLAAGREAGRAVGAALAAERAEERLA
jgi:hypothetical protein